jgi:hypothetical protein
VIDALFFLSSPKISWHVRVRQRPQGICEGQLRHIRALFRRLPRQDIAPDRLEVRHVAAREGHTQLQKNHFHTGNTIAFVVLFTQDRLISSVRNLPVRNRSFECPGVHLRFALIDEERVRGSTTFPQYGILRTPAVMAIASCEKEWE